MSNKNDSIAQGDFVRKFKATSLDHARRECRQARENGGVYTYGEERPHMGQRVRYVVTVYRESKD